jgi:hypothetical protein
MPFFVDNDLVLLRHELNRDLAHAEISGKNSRSSISQMPRHYWVLAVCDAVVLRPVRA